MCKHVLCCCCCVCRLAIGACSMRAEQKLRYMNSLENLSREKQSSTSSFIADAMPEAR